MGLVWVVDRFTTSCPLERRRSDDELYQRGRILLLRPPRAVTGTSTISFAVSHQQARQAHGEPCGSIVQCDDAQVSLGKCHEEEAIAMDVQRRTAVTRIAISGLFLVAVFALDLVTPLGIPVWLLYGLPFLFL